MPADLLLGHGRGVGGGEGHVGEDKCGGGGEEGVCKG